MKKGFLGILTALMALTMIFTMVSCGDNGGSTKEYTITFDKGVVLPAGTAVTGTVTGLPTSFPVAENTAIPADKLTATPTLPNYTFAGWGIKVGGVIVPYTTQPITGDTVVYAMWLSGNVQIIYKTVTFEDAEGEEIKSVQVIAGTTVAQSDFPAAPAPSTAGELFNGWFLPGSTDPFTYTTVVTSDITVEPRFVAAGTTYTVTFEDAAGAELKKVEDVAPYATVPKASFPADPTPAEGYEFSGWVVKGSTAAFTETTPISGDTTVVAYFTVTGGTDPGGTEESFTIKFIPWEGYEGDEITINIDEGVTIADWLALDVEPANALPAGPARPGYQFGRWEYNGLAVNATSAVTFSTDEDPVVGVYWATTFTDSTGAEKVRLRNGAFVIYEFDLKTAGVVGTGPNDDIIVDDLAAISSISLKQKIDEVAFNNMAVRGMRVYGPYAFNATDIVVNQGDWSTGDVLHGDFKKTAEGMYLAKMNGNGAYTTDDIKTFNKFHPYMAYNNAVRFGYNNGDNPWTNVAGISEITESAIAPDTWFTVTYPLAGDIPATDANGQSLGQTLLRLKQAGAIGNLLPPGTNYNKVYFAIGPSTETPEAIITYLMKDVSLKIGSVDVPGVTPELDGVASSWDQTFACYESAERFSNWRGMPDAEPVDQPQTGTDEEFTGPLDTPHDAAGGAGSFYLRLGDYKTTPVFTPAETIDFDASSFTGGFTQGPLTVRFNGTSRPTLNIALTPAQIEILANVDTDVPLTITIDGSASPDSEFRYYIGNATLGGGWNATSGSGQGVFSSKLETEQTVSNKAELKYFILQLMGGASDSTVTINSIKIDYTYVPPVPCECTDAQCGTDPFMLHCVIPTGGLCTCPKPYTVLANLDSINGLQQAGGPKFARMNAADGNGLFVYLRPNDYSAVDLQIVDTAVKPSPAAWEIGISKTTSYRIKVTGKAVVATGVEAQLVRTNRPYSSNVYATGTITGTDGEAGTFEVEAAKILGSDIFYRADGSDADITDTTGNQNDNYNSIRIRVQGTGDPSFIIDTVEIYSVDGTTGADIDKVFTFNKE